MQRPHRPQKAAGQTPAPSDPAWCSRRRSSSWCGSRRTLGPLERRLCCDSRRQLYQLNRLARRHLLIRAEWRDAQERETGRQTVEAQFARQRLLSAARLSRLEREMAEIQGLMRLAEWMLGPGDVNPMRRGL